MNIRSLILALFLFVPTLLISGVSNGNDDNVIHHPKKVYRKTLRQIGNGELSEAKQNLTDLIAVFPDNYEYNTQMALLLFWDFGDYASAIPYFEKVLKLSDDKKLSGDIQIFLAKCFQYDNQFEASNKLYKQFIDDHAEDENMVMVAKKAIQDNNHAIGLLKDIPKNFAMVKHFGKRINSRFPDYVPVLINRDTTLLFTSRRPVNETENSYFEAFDYPEHIYGSHKHKGGFQKAIQFMPQEFYGDFYKKGFHHHSIVNISYDGKKMILYAKNKLWLTQKDEDSWNKPKPFQKKINFSFYQPHACFSPSGDTIYFTSVSKKSGIGGKDIFFSVKAENGNWQNAKLAPEINTPFDEDSPEISSDGKNLYFSSKGLEGIGGYDIYVSNKIDGKWQNPRNLGIPVNSSGDDIFYKPSTDNQTAFFSSWRKGGLGHMDIYEVIRHAQFKECVSLDSTVGYPLFFSCPDTVVAGKEITFKGNFAKMPNAFVDRIFWNFGEGNIKDSLVVHHAFSIPGKTNIKLEVFAFDTIERITKDFCVSKNIFVSSNEPILAITNQEIPTDTITSQQSVLAQIDTTYSATDTSSTTTITTTNLTAATTKATDSLIIYYDFDIRVFRKEMNPVVNNYITEQIKTYPNQKIKISGYTDYWGNYKYNFVLSKQRAEALKKYLIDKGVNASRFVETEGLGESQQITDESLLKNHPYAHTIPELNRRAKIILLK
ncbi:MAG: OmpA family protein [Bacteroidales bacterium]|nr:OmpA family protein [Bacteroidales bacterium]